MRDGKGRLSGLFLARRRRRSGSTDLLFKSIPVGNIQDISASWIFDVAPSGTTGQIKAWNGSAFTAKPVKFWNGSSWTTKPVKFWNGSSWVTTTY